MITTRWILLALTGATATLTVIAAENGAVAGSSKSADEVAKELANPNNCWPV